MKPRFGLPSVVIAAAVVILALAHALATGTVVHRFHSAALAGAVAIFALVAHWLGARRFLRHRKRGSS